MPEIGLDGIIRSESGELGGKYVEVLGTCQSLSDARRMLDSMCEGWVVKERTAYSVIYHRSKDGIEQERTVKRKANRQWQVTETTIQID